MPNAERYAKWLVDNQDKKDTPEFTKVAEAYKAARATPQAGAAAPASPAADTQPTGDVAATEPEQTPLFRRGTGLFIQNPFQRAPTRQEVGTGVKYGVPLAAGAAAAPFVGAGAGGAALLSAIGGVSGYGSSIAGQAIAGDEISQREALSDAALMAMPVATRGSFLGRALANLPGAIGAVEASEAIRTGEYTPPANVSDAFARWGAVGGMALGASYLGARAQRVGEVRAASSAIQQERMGGAAMISELMPEMQGLERRVLKNNNRRALQLMNEMDAPFDQAIARSFPEAETNKPIRDYLARRKEEFTGLRAEVDAANQAAQRAQERAIQLSSGDNLRAYDAAKREAFDLAMIAESKRLAQGAAERAVLGQNALNASEVGIARQIESVNRTMEAARGSLREGIADAYRTAGIGPNTPVVSLGSVKASISRRAGPGGVFQGNLSRRETIDALNDYFAKHGDGQTISLEAMQNLQTGLGEQLAAKGVLPSRAQRIAAEAYDVVKSSSDNYIRRNMPDQYAAWTKARSLASQDFALRETQAMEYLRRGDAEQFYNAISKEGKGQTIEAIGTFARLLSDAGQPQAAAAFTGEVNKIIARGVLRKASAVGTGRDSITELIDPSVLWKELDTLRVNKFPVEQLGLGSPAQIRAAARLSSVKRSGGITTKELDEFLDLASDVGENKAVAKMNYFNAVRNEQIANGTRQQRLAAYEARQAAQRANVTQADRSEALLRLSDDPIVRLINDPSFSVPTGATNSAKFNAAVMSLEPSTASAFVDAMQAAGRGGDLENLRKGLSYGVMGKRKTLADGSTILDNNAITDFFFKKGDMKADLQRDVFRRIVGKEAYENMEKNIARPLQRVGEIQRGLDYEVGGGAPKFYFRGKPPEGSPLKAAVVGTLQSVVGLIDAGRYNTLYTLYVNPNTAPMWASAMRAGGDLSRQPVLATAIRLAQEQDDKDAATNP
jgi:hypothetical protein